jgi:hypothetical protein
MRRLSIALLSSTLLVLGLAGTALGHHIVSIGCDEDDIKVVANIGDNHRLVVTIDNVEVMDEVIAGSVIDRTFTFAYGGGPATVEVTIFFPGGGEEDSESKEVNCFEVEESIPEESIPEESIPEESIPEESIPEESEPEQSVGGATGTPNASIPDTAAAPATGTALGTLGFGILLLLSLGSLAYANVRAGRR